MVNALLALLFCIGLFLGARATAKLDAVKLAVLWFFEPIENILCIYRS